MTFFFKLLLIAGLIFVSVVTFMLFQKTYESFEDKNTNECNLTPEQKKIIADFESGNVQFRDIMKMQIPKDDMKAIITCYASKFI